MKLLGNLFMKTFYREKPWYFGGASNFLTWFTLPTILKKDIQCQRKFAIILIQADLLSQIIIKSLDPLRAKKTFIRKKLGHTTVSALKPHQ